MSLVIEGEFISHFLIIVAAFAMFSSTIASENVCENAGEEGVDGVRWLENEDKEESVL